MGYLGCRQLGVCSHHPHSESPQVCAPCPSVLTAASLQAVGLGALTQCAQRSALLSGGFPGGLYPVVLVLPIFAACLLSWAPAPPPAVLSSGTWVERGWAWLCHRQDQQSQACD